MTLASGSSWRTALVLGAVRLVTGCGRADDDRGVTAVTERFLEAVAQTTASGRARSSHRARSRRSSTTSPSLRRGRTGSSSSRAAVTRAQVFATEAKVDLADGHSAFLELTSSGWRISAAGCTPRARRPALPVRARSLMRAMFVLYLV